MNSSDAKLTDIVAPQIPDAKSIDCSQMPFVSIVIHVKGMFQGSIGKINIDMVEHYLLNTWITKGKMQENMAEWKRFSKENSLAINGEPFDCNRFCENGTRWAAILIRGGDCIDIYMGLCKKKNGPPIKKMDLAQNLRFALTDLPKQASKSRLFWSLSQSAFIMDNRNDESGIVLKVPLTVREIFFHANVLAALAPFLTSLIQNILNGVTDVNNIVTSLFAGVPVAIVFYAIVVVINWFTTQSNPYWFLKTS